MQLTATPSQLIGSQVTRLTTLFITPPSVSARNIAYPKQARPRAATHQHPRPLRLDTDPDSCCGSRRRRYRRPRVLSGGTSDGGTAYASSRRELACVVNAVQTEKAGMGGGLRARLVW